MLSETLEQLEPVVVAVEQTAVEAAAAARPSAMEAAVAAAVLPEAPSEVLPGEVSLTASWPPEPLTAAAAAAAAQPASRASARSP